MGLLCIPNKLFSYNELADMQYANLKSITQPYSFKEENMFIFYCNDDAGFKIYDAANLLTITSDQIAQYSDIQTNNVISLKKKFCSSTTMVFPLTIL
jgi:hypothetical protein